MWRGDYYLIIYTGEGGRDDKTKKQIKDQELIRGNLALAKCKIENKLIHITRGYKHISEFSPKKGYQYAGLYIVTDYWDEKGLSGHKIFRFKFEKVGLSKYEPTVLDLQGNKRKLYESLKVIRDTLLAKEVKMLYTFRCQVCSLQIELPCKVFYAEGAHIRPLGKPHNGQDDLSNILCLCPNHHVMFDNYLFSILPNSFKLIGVVKGKLQVHKDHNINIENIKYHNAKFVETYQRSSKFS